MRTARKTDWLVGWFPILLVLASSSVDCAAGTLSTLPASGGSSLGTPLDELALEDLGIDLNLFLFTGNTGYNSGGLDELDIISTNATPSGSSTLGGSTLSGSALGSSVTQTFISLSNSGTVTGISSGGSTSPDLVEASGAPEPTSIILGITGLALIATGWARPKDD